MGLRRDNMKGLADILTRVAATGKPEVILTSGSKETTLVCRDIKNRITYRKDFWCLRYKRLDDYTIKIWKGE